jgi:hypothetical protein
VHPVHFLKDKKQKKWRNPKHLRKYCGSKCL